MQLRRICDSWKPRLRWRQRYIDGEMAEEELSVENVIERNKAGFLH